MMTRRACLGVDRIVVALGWHGQCVQKWQRAVVFRLGQFKDIRGPGLFFIIPVIEQLRMIDTRVLAVHIPKVR